MKNKLSKFLIVPIAFLLTSCQMVPESSSPTNNEPESEPEPQPEPQPETSVNYKEGQLTKDELRTIILKAVDMEKNYMSSVFIEGANGEPSTSISITTYNNGYRLYVDPNGKVASYCPPDYSHAYYRTSYGGEPYGNINDYISEYVNDNYIYAFGYGQIGANPAALVACQSFLCYKNLDFNPNDALCQKENNNYIVTFNHPNGGETNLYWKMNHKCR